MTLLVFIVAATTTLFAVDGGCYLWLRANDAHRAFPGRALAGGRNLRARTGGGAAGSGELLKRATGRGFR